MLSLLEFTGILIALMSVAPLIQTYKWWVRVLDFPRLQIVIISVVWLIYSSISGESGAITIVLSLVISVFVLIDLYRILPYTVFMRKPVKNTKSTDRKKRISVLSANVYIENKNYKKLLEVIKIKDPDVVFLVEPDEGWAKACECLKSDYPYFSEIPKDNTYGMLFYSKFPISNTHLKFLTDPEVPSFYTDIEFSETTVRFVGLHPRPPRPQEGSSKQRDVTLEKVAEYLDEKVNLPAIITGDFNDTAWSHSSRAFMRKSGLLDPRKGRGFYNTFPVYLFFLRVPLDHIFHSKDFLLSKIEVCKNIDSDHYPIFVELQLGNK